MKLLIVRHGKAHDPDPREWPDDSERPLTDKGERRFSKSVAAIKALAPEGAQVISSPYTRALQTANILCKKSGWNGPEIDDRLSAHFGTEEALDLLQSLDWSGTYAIVGHPDLVGAAKDSEALNGRQTLIANANSIKP